jgi:hypothetical protein
MKKRTDKDQNTEFTEQTALAVFARLLDEQKWNYHRSGDRPTLYSDFSGDDALWDFNMCVSQKGDGLFLLGVNSFIPNKARPERRAACAELLSRINFELTLGCFGMNHEDGEIRFRTSVALPAADITPGIVEHLLRSNLAIVDVRLKQIMAVLYSNITPAEALKPREENPKSTPEPRFEMN